jgi:hypothetical protein
LSDGRISAEKPLSSEPIWNAALLFAQDEVARGIAAKALLLVAARSSEFDAVNQLSNGVSDLKYVVLTPTLLTWPEDGPGT